MGTCMPHLMVQCDARHLCHGPVGAETAVEVAVEVETLSQLGDKGTHLRFISNMPYLYKTR